MAFPEMEKTRHGTSLQSINQELWGEKKELCLTILRLRCQVNQVGISGGQQSIRI